MKKKIFNIVITLILVFVLLFSVSAFTSCKKEPEKEPDHSTETDPKPTPDPVPVKPVKKEKTYDLHNWKVSLETGVPKIKITEDTYSSVEFPVPEREHFTFNGWYIGEDKVADETGKSLMTKQLFESDEKKIFAKWKAEETFTYKILLVYVTRVDAVLPHKDMTITEKVHLDYTMSDLEREFCHATTVNLKRTMDDMMDGLVDFQIDEYFTTLPIVTEDIHIAQTVFSEVTYNEAQLFPNKIREVESFLDKYDACFSLTNFSTEVRTPTVGGTASGRSYEPYAEISVDSIFYSATTDDKVLEDQLKAMIADPKYNDHANLSWDRWLDTIIHENAHIIEARILESEDVL